MDVFTAAEKYIVEMTTRKGGMKALLLDAHTTAPVSMVYSHSDVLQNEIFMLSQVSDRRDTAEIFPDMEAIVFVRPCPESLMAVDAELRAPRFGKYDICFSGAVDPRDLERLAAADVKKRVAEVTEYYLDFLAVDRTLFTSGIVGCGGGGPGGFAPGKLPEIAASLMSAVMALGLRPTVRYQGNSEMCRALAEETTHRAHRVPTGSPGLVLVLDRRADPVTPLMNQWTYQAMLHELLGIKNGTVSFGAGAGKQQFMLSASGRDPFFDAQKYTPFPVLLKSVSRLVGEYKTAEQEVHKLDTIEDMKRTLMEYSRHKERAENAAKHTSLVTELTRVAEGSDMFGADGVGLLEQELVKVSDQGYAFKAVARLVQSRRVRVEDKVRLTALFVLKFESSRTCEKNLRELLDMLGQSGVPRPLCDALARLRAYGGTSCPARSSNVYKLAGSGLFKTEAEEETGDMMRHTPLLATTLNDLAKGKLATAAFPTVGAHDKSPLRNVVVFMVGGVTYAESRVVNNFNKSAGARLGIRVLLGGTHVHNLASFLEEVTLSTPPR